MPKEILTEWENDVKVLFCHLMMKSDGIFVHVFEALYHLFGKHLGERGMGVGHAECRIQQGIPKGSSGVIGPGRSSTQKNK